MPVNAGIFVGWNLPARKKTTVKFITRPANKMYGDKKFYVEGS